MDLLIQPFYVMLDWMVFALSFTSAAYVTGLVRPASLEPLSLKVLRSIIRSACIAFSLLELKLSFQSS